MMAMRGTERSWAAIALGLTAVLGVASGIVGTLGAGTAVAQPVSLTLKYTCSFPVIGNQSLSARISADIPASHTVGEPSHRFAIHAVATVGTTLTQGLGLLGVKTIEGTLDARTQVAAPQGDLGITVPLTIGKTTMPSSGALSIPANGTAPTRTFTKPGRAKITVGDFVAHLVPRNASGDLTVLGKLDVPCTLDAGQNDVIASFTIGARRTPSASAAPRTSGTTGTRRATGSATAESAPPSTTTPGPSGTTTATPSTAIASATPASDPPGGSTIDDTAAGRTTAGGQDTRNLILLTMAILVVAAAASSFFGLRLRNRRRADEDG
jgi:hypothetical protein